MTPDLAARLAMYRDDLHATLAASPETVPDWTPEERRRLAGCPPRIVELVETAKAVFAPLGGVEVVDVRPFKSAARDDVACLIREARAPVRGRGRRGHAGRLAGAAGDLHGGRRAVDPRGGSGRPGRAARNSCPVGKHDVR